MPKSTTVNNAAASKPLPRQKLLPVTELLRGIPLSAKNAANIRCIALAGMFAALSVVLGYLKLPLSPDNRISFGFIATASAGYLLGPVPAAVMAMAADVLGYILNPSGGAFFPGFTLSAGIGGFVYGLLLYRQPIKKILIPVIIAVFVNTLFVNIILNTWFLSVMYQKAMAVFKYARIIKNAVQFPVHVTVITAVLTAAEKSGMGKLVRK